jgi:NADPH:quinone reductase-like Zn-dependent oxidoreductase
MHAAVVSSFGSSPRYASFADPVAGADEVLVQVEAAGLHPVVKVLADGTHYASTGTLPFIPGVDGVGRLEDGSRVYFGVVRSPFGSFAERTVTRRALCLPVPTRLESATAAALANPGMSSWVALQARARFVPGERVLILGATGAAGQLAVQVAKRQGARRVVAAGRNAEALATLQTLGADAVISLKQTREALQSAFRAELLEHGADVVLDYVWGGPAESLLAAIAEKGVSRAAPRIRFVQVGSSAGPSISLAAATLRSSGVELLGSGFGSASMQELFAMLAEFFAGAAEDGFAMKLQVAPLARLEELWGAEESGTRLVFEPQAASG